MIKSIKPALAILFVLVAAPPFAAQDASPSPTFNSADAPKPRKKIRVSEGVSEGSLVHKVKPEYPPEAKKKHIKGDVILRINIDTQGNVTGASLVKGEPAFAVAAMDAVKQWKYKPYLLNGEPIEVETTATVKFK